MTHIVLYLIRFSRKLRATFINSIIVRKKQKIFCVGRNKTGTTSLAKAFSDLGYIVGDQREAERLQRYYLKGDFDPIIKYCRKAQVFQDYPFSHPRTYKYLDKAYPGSKFILTIRDTPQQWYNSVVRFHSKIFGNGQIPNAGILKRSTYVYKGWIWNNFLDMYQVTEDDPYNKEKLINSYVKHNNEIIEYFINRPDDFIIINLSDPGSYQRLMEFLHIESPYERFPWENKTSRL